MAPKAKAAADAKAKAAAKVEARVTRSAAKVAPKAEAKAETKATAASTEAEDKKRKAEEEAKNAAPKKEAKTEEPKPKKEEKDDDAEKEQDSPTDKRPQMKEAVEFLPSDTTLNIVPTQGNKVLMSLSEGGMQYMIAGARANVGVKAGRYTYEVKIIEALNPAESAGAQRGKVPMPRQLVRLGFSTAESHLILGQDDEAVFFDAEGNYNMGKTKKMCSQRFTRDQVITVVLNLDSKSVNNNTISLFKEGERVCQPQPLPENLRGKPLFPHVSFRSVTVQMGFGPNPLKTLPFTCRPLATAAQADVTVRTEKLTKDGKCEVLVPIAFPDEGTFDWLDGFLEKNPHFVEISDRKIIEWAKASGVAKGVSSANFKPSSDKPEFNFGLPGMDDNSIRKVLFNLLPHIPRNYVIMEVKSNLLKEERAELLGRFSATHFKTVATVVMGKPNDEYKEKKLEKRLQEKQEKANVEWKAKKAEEERKKQVALRQKQLADMRKKAEEQRKKVLEEAKKKREAEAAKKEKEKKKKEKEAAKKKKEAEKAKKAAERQKKIEAGEEVPEEEEEPEEPEEPSEEEPEDEVKKEEVKDEVKEEETKDEEMKEEEDNEPPPTVELTEEEKAEVFKKGATDVTDLTSATLEKYYGKFTVPDTTEGFDEMRFEWDGQAESTDYLRKWVIDRKANSRMDDLQPSDWFKEKHHEWLKLFAGWQASQKKYNVSPGKRAKDIANKKKEEARKKAEADGAEVEEEDVEMEVDIFAVENLDDMKDGEPLYAKFAHEDWALLQLRFELYFLQLGFRKDVDDDDRPGVHDQHLAFYYTKYFRKSLNIKHFNVASNKELCELVKDTVTLDEEKKVLMSALSEETEAFDIFVKHTEENRRERQRRIDAGDETARIKFSPLAVQQPPSAKVGAAAKPAGTVGAAVIKPKEGGIRPTTASTVAPPVRPAYGRLSGIRPVGPR